MKQAEQTQNTRNAYSALVNARQAGKLLQGMVNRENKTLAWIFSTQETRQRIADVREDARLDLEMGGHYPGRLDPAGTWEAENRDGEPYTFENNGYLVKEYLTLNLHNDLGEYACFEYIATYHVGREDDNSLEYSRSYYHHDEDDNKVPLSSVHAYKTARAYADKLARNAFFHRGRDEYSRDSIVETNAPWQLDIQVEAQPNGYDVTFYDDPSGVELLTISFNTQAEVKSALIYSPDTVGGLPVNPKPDEMMRAREAVVEYLQTKLRYFQRFIR